MSHTSVLYPPGPAHREIRVSLPFPIYDEAEREETIERLRLQEWGRMHANCWGSVCYARSEPYCQSRHEDRGSVSPQPKDTE
jgi:hypothetical protein